MEQTSRSLDKTKTLLSALNLKGKYQCYGSELYAIFKYKQVYMLKFS